MRVRLAILVTLVLVHTSVAPSPGPVAPPPGLAPPGPGRLKRDVTPKPIPPEFWTSYRKRFSPRDRWGSKPSNLRTRVQPKCKIGTRHTIGDPKSGRNIIHRTIKGLKEVPEWVANLLSTSPRLPDLDKQTKTRIMGVGFLTSTGSCMFPVQADSKSTATGTFFYIADVDENNWNSHRSIWNVLRILNVSPPERQIENVQHPAVAHPGTSPVHPDVQPNVQPPVPHTGTSSVQPNVQPPHTGTSPVQPNVQPKPGKPFDHAIILNRRAARG